MALELAEQGSAEWSHLLVQHLRAAWHLRMLSPDELANFQHACVELEEAGYLEAAAEAGALAAWAIWVRGDRATAEATARHATELLATAPPSRAKAAALSELGRQLAIAGEGDEAIEATGKAFEMATDLGLVDLQILSLNNRGLARSRIGDPGAVPDLERSIELARDANVGQGIVRGYGNLSSLLWRDGELRRAFELIELGRAEADRFRIDSAMRWMRGEQILIDYHCGRWDDVVRRAEEWVVAHAGAPPHFMDAHVHVMRAVVFAARGNLAAALEEDGVQIELARSLDPQTNYPSLSSSAWLRALAGDHATAEERFDALLRRWGENPEFASFEPNELAFAAAILGRTDAFLSVAEVARPTKWLDAACAFVRGDYARAAEMYAEIGSLPAEAYARLAAGDEANVRRALEFYRSVGANFFIARAEALLPASA
jgi:tetratricopeptide (TPR) repeat protein